MKKLAIILTAFLMTGCTSSSDANKALKNQGFTDIQIKGYAWFECSEDDVFKTSFRAKNLNGKFVEGTVCSGWLKGATIRY